MKKIEGKVRKALHDYNMIENGDKIAIALSGGKDSVALTFALSNIQRHYTKKFEVVALTINPGFEEFDETILQEICKKANVELHIISSEIKQIVFDERKEKNPCSLCANLRRGMLNSCAKELGCNKIALGHNQDDVLETFLMNMIYAGNLSTFSPVSYMDRSEMSLIRPLIYLTEKETRAFTKRNGIEVMPKVCKVDGATSREYALNLLQEFENKNKHARASIMGAIKRTNLNGWKE